MDNYSTKYSGKNLRYGIEAGELLINVADLCSIIDIELGRVETLDLTSAVHLAEAYDPDLAAWLRERFSMIWLYDQMRASRISRRGIGVI